MADNVTVQVTAAATANVSAEEITTLNGASVTAQEVQRIAPVLVTADGVAVDLPGDATNGAKVQVSTSVLPTGGATSAKQDTGNTSLSSIDGKLPALVAARLSVDPSGVTSPVSLATLPSLVAGLAAIGKLAANAGVTIGAVEIAASQTLATVTNLATIGTSVTPGTAAAHLGKAEDAPHASGDTGVMALGVQKTADAALGADGDYEPLQLDASGYLKVNVKTGSLTGTIKTAPVASSAVTISLASLASDTNLLAGRESTAIDNSTNKYLDYLLAGVIRQGTTPTTGKEIRVYVVGIANDTTWPDVFDGTDSNETVTTTGIRDSICRLAAVMSTTATSDQDNWFGPVSVAALFGGVLPLKFGVFVVHNTGVALNATGGNHVISITPFNQTLS